MRWRDALLLGPVALVAVVAGLMAFDPPPAIVWLISGASAALIVAYLVLERLRPRSEGQRHKRDAGTG